MIKLKNRGFTLVELLVVIIIIAILAAIAIPKFINSTRAAAEASARTQIMMVRNAVNQFQQDTGWWPASIPDLFLTSCPPNGLNGGGKLKSIDPTTWNGPYIGGQRDQSVFNTYISYGTSPPNTGQVWCPVSGTALDGSQYSNW